MPDASLRRITLLELLPRRAPGCTSSELRIRLEERGYPADLRTIQRDLEFLSSAYPLISEGERPAHWRWAESSHVLSIPGQDAYSALTWRLIEEHLRPLLPSRLADEAEPQFDAARRFLDSHSSAPAVRWSERVRVLPRAFHLAPPEIENAVLQALYTGLFEGRVLEVAYESRESGSIREWTVHPLALVLRDGLLYLVCLLDGFEDIRQLAAHRVRHARVGSEPVREPPDFDLDAYIEGGAFDYGSANSVRLVFRMEPYAAQHVLETPLGDDQAHRTLDDGRIEISATVRESNALYWWLQGFGSQVEVVRPARIRKEILRQAREIVARSGDE